MKVYAGSDERANMSHFIKLNLHYTKAFKVVGKTKVRFDSKRIFRIRTK